MPTQYNAASRILKIVDLALRKNDNDPVLTVWREAFEVFAEDVSMPYKVAAKLALVFEEIQILESQLDQEAIIPRDLYMQALDQMREVFSPQRLNLTFAHLRAMLSMEHYRTLQMLVGILRSEEVEATFDEIQELHSLISDLQELIGASRLSPQLISLLQNHIDALRRALANYSIGGPRSIKEALRIMSLEMLPVQDEIIANGPAAEITLLQKIWIKAVVIGASAGTVNDLYGAAQLGWGVASAAIAAVAQGASA
ncbi:hypothetical protein JOD97_005582 [Duganella sp. 1411]|uniref:hypothetical protein n=1 Tax=Duganella sp. 1411 TaxID=2806572 RepID=UPI001AE92FBF|nr:hypothetical protein [Duganella sp. 1411]MBP1207502.1 hypothetical protein [Duganella sp. 1411]